MKKYWSLSMEKKQPSVRYIWKNSSEWYVEETFLRNKNFTYKEQRNRSTLVWSAWTDTNILSEETERKAASAHKSKWILFIQNPAYRELPTACDRILFCPEAHCNKKLWDRGCSHRWKEDKFKLKCYGVGAKEKLSKCYRARKVGIIGVSTVVNPAGLTE